MNFFNTTSPAEFAKLTVTSIIAWAVGILLIVASFGCTPIKVTSAIKAPVAVPQMVEVEEVILLGALPQSSKTENGGFQKASFSPSPDFGFVTVTVTNEWQDVAEKKFCEVAWEGYGVSNYTAVVNGRELELSPVSTIAYLTPELGQYTLSAKIVGNKVEITNETPTGAVRTRFLSKPSVYKGANYTGSVAVAKINTDWYLILADTDKGVHAECVSAPESNLIR